MGQLIYLTGPVRSGKSRRAVELATVHGDHVVFVATWKPDTADAEMAERVRRHRAERPAAWRTLEAPDHVSTALARLDPPPSAAIIDCLTLWLSARLEQSDNTILAEWEHELEALRAAAWTTIIVGNEVGWSPVPEHPVTRRFRDLAGLLGQRTAAAADAAWLMVAGCPIPLKSDLSPH